MSGGTARRYFRDLAESHKVPSLPVAKFVSLTRNASARLTA